jgi:hypothetical protein
MGRTLEVSATGELAVQRSLRVHGLAYLVREYGLKACRHVLFPELVSLKYSQLKASFDQQIVRQCRYVIICAPGGSFAVSHFLFWCLSLFVFFFSLAVSRCLSLSLAPSVSSLTTPCIDSLTRRSVHDTPHMETPEHHTPS